MRWHTQKKSPEPLDKWGNCDMALDQCMQKGVSPSLGFPPVRKNGNTPARSHTGYWLSMLLNIEHRGAYQLCHPDCANSCDKRLWSNLLIRVCMCVWHLASCATPLSFLDENVGQVQTDLTWTWSLTTRLIDRATFFLSPVAISTRSSMVRSLDGFRHSHRLANSSVGRAVAFLCNASICWDSRRTTISVDLCWGFFLFWGFFCTVTTFLMWTLKF